MKSNREILLRILENRKEQIRVLEEGYIKPLKDNIKIIKDCMYGKDNVEHLQYHSKSLNKHLKKLMKIGGV